MAESNRTSVKTHNGKHEIIFTPGNHRYKVDGEYKKGVTTILGLLSKDALAPWAANMACKYIEENCEVGMFANENAVSWIVEAADLKAARKYHATYRDSAADTGKAVHAWIENYLKGNAGQLTPDMRPSVTAFLAWEKKYKPEVISSERITYSEQLDLCGTTDLVCIIDDKLTVLDFKTGKPEEEYDQRRHEKTGRKRAYTSVFMQDAFYDIAIEEEDGRAAWQYGALYLPVTGGYSFFLDDNVELYRELAKSLRQTHLLYDKAMFSNKYQEAA